MPDNTLNDTQTNYAAPVSINLIAPQLNTGRHQLQIGVLGVDGNPHAVSARLTVEVDSGSCGLVIPAEWLYQAGTYHYSPSIVDANSPPTGTLLEGVSCTNNPGKVIYQPSSDDLNGFYYIIDSLALGLDEAGAPQTILQNVRVLGIVNRTPQMMGVGFDRPVIADNPFLLDKCNLQNQPLYPSYYIEHAQIVLGELPTDDIAYQTLTPYTDQNKPTQLPAQNTAPTVTYSHAPLWNPLQGSVTALPGGPTSTQCGILLDTGLDLMMVVNVNDFIQPNEDANAATLSGATVSIAVSDTALTYSFTLGASVQAKLGPTPQTTTVYATANSNKLLNGNIGQNDPPGVDNATPCLVDVITNQTGKQPFLNIGFNPLYQFGLFVDWQNKRVGFPPLGKS